MNKYIVTLVLVTLVTTFTGCGIKTNINVNVNSNSNTEEIANIANPIVNISDDAEYEKQLGIKWDTSFLAEDIKRFIIGEKVAEASYIIKNTEGEDIEIVLRGTKDTSVEKSPVELLAGIYSQDLSKVNEINVTADNGTITFLVYKAPDVNMGIEYFNHDDVYYTITYGTSLSQMTIAEINDSVLATIGAININNSDIENNTGKVVSPMVSEIDVNDLNGRYVCKINSVENLEDGTVEGNFDIYTMDLYDAVEITTLEVGDSIIVGDDEIVIETIEEGEPIELRNADIEESGLRAVYIINGGVEEGGAEFIAGEGGTFRFFGLDDHATYTKVGDVKVPISSDAVIVDHSHDYDSPEQSEEGIVIETKDFKEYFEEDMYDGVSYFYQFNTSMVVEDGTVIEIIRIYIP